MSKLFTENKKEDESVPARTNLTKACPQCLAQIPISAKKCSHCGSDLRTWSARHPFLGAILVIVVFLFVVGILGNIIQQGNGSSTPNQSGGISPTPTPIVASVTPQPTKPQPKKAQIKNTSPIPTTNQTAVFQNTTNNTAPTPSPTQAWHTVQTFSGNGDINTSTFTIQGSQWEIKWSATAESNDSYCQQNGCNLLIQPYHPANDLADSNIYADDIKTTESGSGYFYDSGQFYLKITEGNLTNWTITVLDYY